MLDARLTNSVTDIRAYGGKTLGERVTGRFYTPELLARDLSNQTLEELSNSVKNWSPSRGVRICDPFCGDGRLITAILEALAERQELRARALLVTLRDIDPEAVKVASSAAIAIGTALGLEITLNAKVCDSFSDANPAANDLVITNPPWELLKPDTRETAHLDASSARAYLGWLKSRCAELDERFPDAKADVAWAGWGTNLARCGWDLALRSCDRGGILGIVLPSTILADQASMSMRKAAFCRARLKDIATYPAEARLFSGVDQPVITATFVVEPGEGINAPLRIFGSDRKLKKVRTLHMIESELEASEFALPIGFGAEASEVLSLFSDFPRFRNLEGDCSSSIWAGRELDETNLAAKLRPAGKYPFIKGRLVQRHGIVEEPQSSVDPALASRYGSAAFERLVWRDVSRPSQRRRMIGTIVPPMWIAGNSLHVAYFKDGNPNRLRALHAILSSFIFEFQVRSRCATGHMSLGIVRDSRIPRLNKKNVNKLSVAAMDVLTDLKPEKEVDLEVKVARAYGIDREQFAEILDQFPKLCASEREALLDKSVWRRAAK